MYCLEIGGQVDLNLSFPTILEADLAARAAGAMTVLKIVPVRDYPRLLTEEQREVLTEEMDLREFFNCSTEDGLGLELAQEKLYESLDLEFIHEGLYLGNPDEDELSEDVDKELREILGPEVADKLIAARKEIL